MLSPLAPRLRTRGSTVRGLPSGRQIPVRGSPGICESNDSDTAVAVAHHVQRRAGSSLREMMALGRHAGRGVRSAAEQDV
jgi:hypothetical protein